MTTMLIGGFALGFTNVSAQAGNCGAAHAYPAAGLKTYAKSRLAATL